jgi:CRP/FNR family transcriptional regulator
MHESTVTMTKQAILRKTGEDHVILGDAPVSALTWIDPVPPARAGQRPIELTCSECRHRPSCLTGGLPEQDLARVEKIVYVRRRVKRGERLFIAGDEFRSIYAVSSGVFKTSIVDDAGREQVTGFSVGGELLGMEGLGGGRCVSTATALADSVVCSMPYALIQETAATVPALERRLRALLGNEILRGQSVMLLLGSMAGEARLAAFLVNLSRRLLRCGYSRSSFALRMTREEIGSYLGLKLETVSRFFTAMRNEGLLEVDGKDIRIVDFDGLKRMATAET